MIEIMTIASGNQKYLQTMPRSLGDSVTLGGELFTYSKW